MNEREADAALEAHLQLGEKLEDARFVHETLRTARIIAESLFWVEGEQVALDPDVLFDIYDRLERRERQRWDRLAVLAEDTRKGRAVR